MFQTEKPLVLAVVDDDQVLEILRDHLGGSGFAFGEARNGLEAVDAATRLRPDVIVMDDDLPWRNGREAARLLKTDPRTWNVPILLLTGHDHRNDVDLYRAGCDALLAKPYPLDELSHSILRVLIGFERAAPHSTARLLLVEDDTEVRLGLHELLAENGYDVTDAANGLEALAYLRHCRQQPDLILLDLMMPLMDGWQFRAAQRRDSTLADIPVVVLTAVPPTQRARARLDVSTCLQKPLNLRELLGTVEKSIS
jgi:CheY-like chemotaxis protein